MARWRTNPEKGRDDLWEFSLLTTIAAVLIMVIMFLLVLEAWVKDPGSRWAILLVLLAIAGSFLIYMVFPRRTRVLEEESQIPEDSGRIGKTGLDASNYARALEGNPYSQMIVLRELREVALRRIMLNRHFSRVEAEALAGSVKALKQEVEDPQVVWLLATDFEYEYSTENLTSRMGREMLANFKSTYLSLLRKVEDLR